MCVISSPKAGGVDSPTAFSQQGVLASSCIPRGTIVLREKPILSFNVGDSPNFSSAVTAQRIAKKWNTLSLPEQVAFERLQSNTGFIPTIDDWAVAIWYSNCLSLHSETTGGQYGVPIVGSRFKHSCRPNVHVHFVTVGPEAPYAEFRTICPVAPNTQLQITYDNLGILGTAAQRNGRLLSRKGIRCRCESCWPPTAESDQVRSSAHRVIEIEGDRANRETVSYRKISQRHANVE